MMWLSTLLWLSRLLCTTSPEAHERAQRKGAAPGAQYHDPYPEVPEEPLRKIALYSLRTAASAFIDDGVGHPEAMRSGRVPTLGVSVMTPPREKAPHADIPGRHTRKVPKMGELLCSNFSVKLFFLEGRMTNLRLAVTRDMDYRDAARKFKLCIEIAPGYETEGTRSIDLWQGKFGSVNTSIALLGSTWILIGLVQIGTSRIQILFALRWGETVGGNISPPFVLMLAVCITA
ncbi:hypothetical protein C8F04DRAFT_1200224 [Mycena alexandri]|uniref:Uncharacterized protein n=1 Tax=Mycena alexandri TaxID=1745969 RepID=A0AAD6WKU2_9AGAR|nr:hypothetical protein C8F04DRAFT_1200224 [Mycena alexandri]